MNKSDDKQDKSYSKNAADLQVSINNYKFAIKKYLAEKIPENKVEFEDNVREIILLRNRIAHLLSCDDNQCYQILTSSELELLSALDGELKNKTSEIVRTIGINKFLLWRTTVQPPEQSWWWRLDELVSKPKSYLKIFLYYLSWVLIAVSLSYSLEIVRRFLSGGTDLPSVVVQGLLALIAGGTLVQGAKSFIEGGLKHIDSEQIFFKNIITRYLIVLTCILSAITLHYARPHIAIAYNNWGEQLYAEGQLTEAINKYQRALGLDSNYAAAHYNIANAYEDSLDYDKAIAEYKMAILTDNELFASYNNLARLYITQRSDYLNAIKLIDIALTLRIDADNEEGRNYIKSKMYKNRGWANFGLKNYEQAKDDLYQAFDLNGNNAEAFCVLAEVLEAQNDKDGALENWQACSELGANQKNEMDARWLGLVRERLK